MSGIGTNRLKNTELRLKMTRPYQMISQNPYEQLLFTNVIHALPCHPGGFISTKAII